MNTTILTIIIVAALAFLAGYKAYLFSKLTSEKQLTKVREWLLYAVATAEKELGGGTGQLKLRMVYGQFLEKFPDIAKVLSFEKFSNLTDEALEIFKHMMESNVAVKTLIS